ncbi:glycosyltransferase family 1 protein [Algoriphagus jejuensis]|uniref:Glycosyltransferase family 1 protein n=1 Tax=Algoriphagus jejuensis TaxID=419934 RepID=A0ABN1N4L3_9BACT
MSRKLAILGIVGVPANYGGFETLVENLLDLLPKFYDVTVFCESKSYPEKIGMYKGAKLVYLNQKANGVSSIVYDAVSLLRTYKNQDYILLLGVSGAFMIPLLRPFCKAKIITHIDGLEWRRDKWGFFAKKFLKFSERLAVRFSHGVVADNKHIQNYIAQEYRKSSFLIAYGANHVSKVEPHHFLKKFSFLNSGYVFTVCRIEPENNIEMQLRAFKECEIGMPYVVVGNWSSNEYGMKLYQEYSKVQNIILYNPIYENEELNVLRSNCFFYLHGHSAGGTNPSLVEAMYLGLPVIAYGVNYNRETTFGKALYFGSFEELKGILFQIRDLDSDQMKLDLAKLAKKNYSWRAITKKYVAMLESL